MKKINSVISLLIILTITGHIVTTMVYLLTGFRIEILSNIFARGTYGLVLGHILLSVGMLIFKHDAKPVPGKYTRLTLRVWIQRGSGLFMLILLHAHISQMVKVLNAKPIDEPGKVVFLLINILFFATIFTHVAVSFSRAFVSLGIITDDQIINKIDVATYIVCAVGFVATVCCLVNYIIGYQVM